MKDQGYASSKNRNVRHYGLHRAKRLAFQVSGTSREGIRDNDVMRLTLKIWHDRIGVGPASGLLEQLDLMLP